MKILFSNDKYPYLEMARVGITEDNLDIIIRTDDPGKIPHFHIIDRSNKDKKNNEGCIRIDRAKYFSHGGKTMTLNSQQRKHLVKFLNKAPEKSKHYRTNWELLVDMWNLNNSDVQIPEGTEMPDYTKLK